MKTENNIVAELQRIAARSGGILKPLEVVKSAQNPKSPLHSRFEWDNAKASHAYRIWQARQLIAVAVTVIGANENAKPDRIWVSLQQDRGNDNGGYRELISVLSDSDLRAQLLEEALADMEYFSQKYSRLEELSEVFRAVKKIRVQHSSKVASRVQA